MSEITMLPTNKIYPHPNNPRISAGDVSELKESIIAKGILQNLTVVPRGKEGSGEYTVVIGHRRLGAAKAAGIKEVPCRIADMTPAEQMETMLLENIQRSDLTPYEQAQGFQMMMDLGTTKSEISRKTGFSRTTIDHRLKLLELDQEKLKDVSHQITMKDLILLEKVKSSAKRNELMQNYKNSYTFQTEINYAVREEKNEERRNAFFLEAETLRESGQKITISEEHPDWMEYQFLWGIYFSSGKHKSLEQIIEENDLQSRHIYIHKLTYVKDHVDLFIEKLTTEKGSGQTQELTPEQQERQEKMEQLRDKADTLSREEQLAREHILNFLTEFRMEGKPIEGDSLIKYLAAAAISDVYGVFADSDNIASILLPGWEDYQDEWNYDQEAFIDKYGMDLDDFAAHKLSELHPMQVLFTAVTCKSDAIFNCRKSNNRSGWNRCIFTKQSDLIAFYEMLEGHGYEPYGWEHQLIEGTHGAYAREEDLLP